MQVRMKEVKMCPGLRKQPASGSLGVEQEHVLAAAGASCILGPALMLKCFIDCRGSACWKLPFNSLDMAMLCHEHWPT